MNQSCHKSVTQYTCCHEPEDPYLPTDVSLSRALSPGTHFKSLEQVRSVHKVRHIYIYIVFPLELQIECVKTLSLNDKKKRALQLVVLWDKGLTWRYQCRINVWTNCAQSLINRKEPQDKRKKKTPKCVPFNVSWPTGITILTAFRFYFTQTPNVKP